MTCTIIESDGLSGVFVSIALVEASGSACVDQYFTVRTSVEIIQTVTQQH